MILGDHVLYCSLGPTPKGKRFARTRWAAHLVWKATEIGLDGAPVGIAAAAVLGLPEAAGPSGTAALGVQIAQHSLLAADKCPIGRHDVSCERVVCGGVDIAIDHLQQYSQY